MKTKRRKVWVNELEGDLGSVVWHFHANARTAAMSNRAAGVQSTPVPFIESRPGDVVLSREDAEWLRQKANATDFESAADEARTLAILRGGR